MGGRLSVVNSKARRRRRRDHFMLALERSEKKPRLGQGACQAYSDELKNWSLVNHQGHRPRNEGTFRLSPRPMAGGLAASTSIDVASRMPPATRRGLRLHFVPPFAPGSLLLKN